MKTPCNNSKIYRPCFLLMAVIVAFICSGCEKDDAYDEPWIKESTGEWSTEYIYVRPSGTVAHAFDGSVILDFPPGTVATGTRFAIVPLSLDQLDLQGNNLMHLGISIVNVTNYNKFENPVKLLMRYDLAEYSNCMPEDENCLAIYRFFGDSRAFHKIESLGECCVDCSCKTIQACISECGTYVVGQN